MARHEADDPGIPTGRVRRTARVGALLGGQTARAYATKAANLTRSDDGRREAAERRQIEAAEQIVEVLGSMKGAAMKVGQVASFVDTGALPPEASKRIQQKLAELRDSAPRASFKDMRRVIEQDLGERLGDAFADFDEDAVAAASIGQVYRACTTVARWRSRCSTPAWAPPSGPTSRTSGCCSAPRAAWPPAWTPRRWPPRSGSG
jgi:predicted unusual protein kinase regulating ubiquinone biosynthesis (AarF/ABC1/UbiB family)